MGNLDNIIAKWWKYRYQKFLQSEISLKFLKSSKL
jgi:hypothetical protein